MKIPRMIVSSAILFLALTAALLTAQINPCQAGSSATPVQIKTKAKQCQQHLRRWIQEGRDVSQVAPRMKRVAELGRAGKLEETNALLDEILRLFSEGEAAEKEHIENASWFRNPRKVTITGYDKSAMEAFISRDGRYLFFNSWKEGAKDIYYAKRVDDVTFDFMGEVKGINTHVVEGVPTMDRAGNFYYVSPIHFNKAHQFVLAYKGKFKDGTIESIRPLTEISLNQPGWGTMDIEISADGQTLYYTQTYFGDGNPPTKSYFQLARLQGDQFVTDERSDEIFKNISSDRSSVTN